MPPQILSTSQEVTVYTKDGEQGTRKRLFEEQDIGQASDVDDAGQSSKSNTFKKAKISYRSTPTDGVKTRRRTQKSLQYERH